MRPSTLPVCLLLTLGLDSAAAQQDPKKQSFEVLSLQHLCASHEGQQPPAWGTMLQYHPGANQNDLLQATEDSQQFSPDSVLQMLQSKQVAAIEANKLHLEVSGQNLIVLGDAANVAAVKDELEFARSVLCRPVQIEFAAWDATDRETPPGVMSAADYQRFATNRTQLWRCVATTQANRAVSLARQRWTRYVRDINVEVAQKQTISNPETDSYGEGGHAVVRAMSLIGDEFAVQVQFVTAQKRGIVRLLQTGMVGAADLELPTLETCYGACSARVPNGGALAATLRGHATGGGQQVLTFRVISRQPPQTDTKQGFGVFPCAALTSPGLHHRLYPPPALLADDSRSGDEQEPFGQLEPDHLQQFLRAAHPDEMEREEASMQVEGGYLFVHCSAEGVSKIGITLRSLQDQLVRTVQVQHQGMLAPVDGATGNMSPVLQEISVPTLIGRELTVARLLESPIVRDIMSEIAQEAAMLDPQIDTLQAGTWLRARVAPAGEGMHADLLVQCTHAPIPPARTLMPGGGMIMPTDISSTQVCHDGVVTSGQAIDHGDGPSVTLDGRNFRSTLTTTVRW